MQEDGGAVNFVTNLALGNGTHCCDMLIVRDGDRVLNMLATDDIDNVNFYCSPRITLSDEMIPVEPQQIIESIAWANEAFKRVHIGNNCRMLSNGMQFVERLIVAMTDVTRLHKSAVVEGATPVPCKLVWGDPNPDCGRKGKEWEGRVVRMERIIQAYACNDPVYVAAWTCDVPENGALRIPQALGRVQGVTVNSTVMMLGSSFKNAFSLYSHTVDQVSTDNAPPYLRRFDISQCKIMYFDPATSKSARMSHGFSCELVDVSEVPRSNICMNGCEFNDETRNRLAMVCEMNMVSVMMICGCVVKDTLRFERSHVPFMLAPSLGISFVARDSENGGVSIFADNLLLGVIDVVHRERFDDVLWLAWQ